MEAAANCPVPLSSHRGHTPRLPGSQRNSRSELHRRDHLPRFWRDLDLRQRSEVDEVVERLVGKRDIEDRVVDEIGDRNPSGVAIHGQRSRLFPEGVEVEVLATGEHHTGDLVRRDSQGGEP